VAGPASGARLHLSFLLLASSNGGSHPDADYAIPDPLFLGVNQG
jgi:hypothetical protein